MFSEEKGHQHITSPTGDVQGLVEQRARKGDGRTGYRAVALIAELWKAEFSAFEFFGIEIDGNGKPAVSHQGRRVVPVALEIATPLTFIATDAIGLGLGDSVLKRFLDLGE